MFSRKYVPAASGPALSSYITVQRNEEKEVVQGWGIYFV
jgi:hypothetical protein